MQGLKEELSNDINILILIKMDRPGSPLFEINRD